MKKITLFALLLGIGGLAQAWEWPWNGDGSLAHVQACQDDASCLISTLSDCIMPMAYPSGKYKAAAFQKIVALGESGQLEAWEYRIRLLEVLKSGQNNDIEQMAFQKFMGLDESSQPEAHLYALCLTDVLNAFVRMRSDIKEQIFQKLVDLGKSGQLEASQYAYRLVKLLGYSRGKVISERAAGELFLIYKNKPELYEGVMHLYANEQARQYMEQLIQRQEQEALQQTQNKL